MIVPASSTHTSARSPAARSRARSRTDATTAPKLHTSPSGLKNTSWPRARACRRAAAPRRPRRRRRPPRATSRVRSARPTTWKPPATADDVLRRRLEQLGRDAPALVAHLDATASTSAPPPSAVLRLPNVPKPCGARRVSPWTHRDRRRASTPSWSATTWANVVSWPWPCALEPVMAVTAPERSTLDAAALPAERAGLHVASRARRRRSRRAPAAPPARGAGRRSRRRPSAWSSACGVVAGVIDLAGGGRVRERVGRDQVAPADLGRVEPERARRLVHQPLDDEAASGRPAPRYAPTGARGGQRAGRPRCRSVAAPRRRRAGSGAWFHGEPAAAVHQRGAQRRGDRARAARGCARRRRRQLALAHRPARVVGREHVLPARGDPLHRPAEPHARARPAAPPRDTGRS